MATQKVKTKVKTTTKKETARDQVCALAAGTHPRCGARSPLLHLAAPCHYGTDESAGVLALRLLWAWLVDNSRFYCMAFITSKPRKYLADAVMVTFEVSPTLLTLTHEGDVRWWVERQRENLVSPTLLTLTHEGDVRWWVERQRENLVGANRDYLVVQQIEGGSLLCLQDRATGQRTALMVNNRDEYDWETNGKWMVLCEKAPIREMVVFEIPTKGVASSSSSSSLRGSWANAEPTVVPLDGGVLAGAGRVQLKCDCNFSSANDDHLLMWFYDRKGFFEILLIDLEQTCSSKKLAVLSSTVPRWDDLHLSYNVDLPRASFHVMTREGGVRQFAVHRDAVMVTFEVSPTLLTLTHEGDVRWWVERQRENLVGANRDFLVVQQIEGGALLCLQDRATGQRTALMVNNREEYDWETNGKWMVLCEKAPIREMVVFEIPTKGVAASESSSSSSSSRRGSWANAEPTVVPLDGVLAGAGRVQLKCDCNFSSANDDHLLMWFYDRKGFFEILLVDLEQTCSSKKLAVLSSTVPRWDDLHLSYNVDLPRASCHVMTREGGVRQFAVHRGKKRPKADVYSVEEVSGRLQKIENIKGRIAEMDDCHLYSFHQDLSTYEVWDFNDTSKPLRKTQNHHATDCSDTPHAAGGLLFQVSDSRREIHVTDGFTGVTIVTFQLFRSFTMFTRLYSCRYLG
ncbi:hypothetical protein Pelo_6850 [Pelomyxa schiedti]|nr:hypothetical protein Pelo_6850 [Pelomyxa schiedti]